MKAINAAKAPAAVGPYVHAVQAGNTIYTSGQLGLIPETGVLAEGVEAQAEQAIKNLAAVLEAAGMAEFCEGRSHLESFVSYMVHQGV